MLTKVVPRQYSMSAVVQIAVWDPEIFHTVYCPFVT